MWTIITKQLHSTLFSATFEPINTVTLSLNNEMSELFLDPPKTSAVRRSIFARKDSWPRNGTKALRMRMFVHRRSLLAAASEGQCEWRSFECSLFLSKVHRSYRCE